MTYAASRIVHVAKEPRDNMYVQMRYRLTSSRSGIKTHVETIGMQLFIELALHNLDEF